MATTFERNGNVTIIEAPYTAIDAGNVNDFKHEVESAIEPGAQVVLDLQQVEFVDSAGLGGIVWLLKRLVAQKGNLRLSGVSKSVRALFELVRMHKLIAIHNSVGEAVSSFQSEAGE